MMVRNFFGLVIAVFSLAGCGGQPRLESAGGKPVTFWVDALRSKNVKDRVVAVKKLGNVGPADPAAIPALVEALNDSHADVRSAAAIAILPLGPDAKIAIPALEKATNDRDEKVRQHAGKALVKIRVP